MTAPFVISMKIAGDSSSAVSATGAIRRELAELNKAIVQTSAGAGATLQSRIDSMFGIGGPSVSGRAADIAAYGAELDQLRAKFNPLFAAEQRFAQSQAEIRRARELGAISAAEEAAAIQRERLAYDGLTQSLAANSNARTQNAARAEATGFNTANVAAQFQDIGVTSAMGMSPLQIALQQGTQLSAVLGNQGAAGAAKTLGAALMSVVSPASLLTVAAVGLGAAAIQAFIGIMNSADDANETLEEQTNRLRELLVGYDAAGAAAENAMKRASILPQGVVESDLGAGLAEQEEKAAATRAEIDGLVASYQQLADIQRNVARDMDLGDAGGLDFSPEQKADNARYVELLHQLSVSAGASREDLLKVQVAARELFNTAKDPALRAVANDAFDLAVKTRQAQDAAYALRAALAALQNQAALTDVSKATDSAVGAIERLKALAPDLRTEYQKAAAELQTALGSAPDALLRQSARDQYEKTIAALDDQKAGANSQRLANSDGDRLRSLHDNIAAQQLALDVIGLSIGETERLTFARQNLAAAEAEAAQNGTTVSAAYRAEVERLAASYGTLQQAIALTKLTGDLQFDRDQLFRTPVEQTVASTLRPIFGNDLTSAQALFAANQIRVNEQLKEMNDLGREITGGFLSTLKSDLLGGTSLFAALGNAGVSALDKIADRALDMAADGLWNMIFGAVFGGGGGFGSLGNDIGGGASFAGVQGFLRSATGNAAGTDYWRGGLTLANENGRGEIFDLPNGTRIVPHDVSMEMARSPGGAAPAIYFSPSSSIVIEGDANRAEVQRALDARDAQWREQLPGMIASYLANPNRRVS